MIPATLRTDAGKVRHRGAGLVGSSYKTIFPSIRRGSNQETVDMTQGNVLIPIKFF